jgi:hypothetical protein
MNHQLKTMNRWQTIHDFAGVLMKDLWRYLPALRETSQDHQLDGRWIELRNRFEVLEHNPQGRGVRCHWTWSSDLHACNVIPAFGRRLMQLALSQWPIEFADAPVCATGQKKITFAFAHDGAARLPHLQQVIRTIFAQQEVPVEIVVVDISARPVGSDLPREVVYLHVDTAGIPAGWRKSWAFNIAARRASSEFLVFHDGDVCIPKRYSLELLASFNQGYDVVSIQRFLFYLDEAATQHVFDGGAIPQTVPARVLQNFKGGTLAARRSTFFEIGGFDEGFVGWGGEDDEFYDRCGARRHCRFGYVPFIHLWHPPQPDRVKPNNLNVRQVLPYRLGLPVEDRIDELRHRDFGNIEGPDPSESYKDQHSVASVAAR